MANRTAALLGQFFKFGIHRAIVDDSPVKLLYRPGGKEKPRERALSEDESKSFLNNLDDACRFQRLPHVLRFLLLTLQRRGELALAEWREFDVKKGTWTIPDAHAKGGRGHVVPLSDWALEELQKLKVMADGSRYVLPNASGTGPIDPKYITRGVSRCLRRFKKFKVEAFTPHDLRRTGRARYFPGLATHERTPIRSAAVHRFGLRKDHARRARTSHYDRSCGLDRCR